MIERTICPDQFTRSDNEVIATIPNGTSFKMVYRFYSNDSNYHRINLRSFDMSVTYYVYGYENNSIRFDKSNISGPNCIIDPECSIVKFLFNGYRFNPGKLYATYEFRIPDPEMPGGYSIDKIEGFTGIIIK